MDDLIDYVVKHFEHEEKEMAAAGYSGLAAHKAEHEGLVKICADLQQKFHAGQAEATDEVGQMVKSWLNSHIPNVDKGYSAVLK